MREIGIRGVPGENEIARMSVVRAALRRMCVCYRNGVVEALCSSAWRKAATKGPRLFIRAREAPC